MSAYGGLYTTGTGQILTVHDDSKCAGRPCVIHNPSDHHMREFPTYWREDRGIMERICPCGIGHPDPDGNTTDRVHGCCGIHCVPPGPRRQEIAEAFGRVLDEHGEAIDLLKDM